MLHRDARLLMSVSTVRSEDGSRRTCKAMRSPFPRSRESAQDQRLSSKVSKYLKDVVIG